MPGANGLDREPAIPLPKDLHVLAQRTIIAGGVEKVH